MAATGGVLSQRGCVLSAAPARAQRVALCRAAAASSGNRSRSQLAASRAACSPHLPRPGLPAACPGRRQQQQPAPPRAVALESLAAATALPHWDALCAVLAAAGAYAWVKIFDGLAGAGIIDQKLSRKLVHSTAGPLFVLTWPFFSDLPSARFFAALVPALNMTRLLLVGSGLVPDPGLVTSVSRQGDRGELLKGPLYYVLVLISITLLFWRGSPAGAVAISMMCGGDGLADIVGRRWGGAKLPWNPSKSWAGSAAMFAAGLGMAAGFFSLFSGLGYFPAQSLTLGAALPALAAVCGVCTLVESLPINAWFDDNLSVPLVAVLGSMAALPLAAAAAASAHAGAGQPQQHLLQMLHLG